MMTLLGLWEGLDDVDVGWRRRRTDEEPDGDELLEALGRRKDHRECTPDDFHGGDLRRRKGAEVDCGM